MRFGVFGPRARRLYRRTAVISITSIGIWLGILRFAHCGKATVWISLPFLLFAFYVSLSRVGIGLYGKEFKKAMAEDLAEEMEELRSKQPLE